METFLESPCNGCGGQCCRDMYGTITEEEFEILKNNNTIYIVSSSDFVLIQKRMLKNIPIKQGLYICGPDAEGIYDVIIGGVCENLNEDGSCRIYKIRPEMCRDFEVESRECINLRNGYVSINNIA